MTLLSDLSLPMQWAECKGLAMVYSYEIALALYQVQAEYGDSRHVPIGRQMTDGRWMLNGDTLSEVGEGGILARAFAHVTPEMMAAVEVVPLEEALALLPAE
jgi:hypothetical protein